MTGIQTALERYYGDYQAYPGVGMETMLTALCGTIYPQGATCVSGSYLSSLPKDPNPSCTVGFGGSWQPCSPALVPRFQYVNPDGHCTGSAVPNGYQLALVKESGGTSYFCSPN